MEGFTPSSTFQRKQLERIDIPEKHFVYYQGGSSKGYAKKVLHEGYWYKLSAGTFNAQAEVVASRLAKYTNIGASVKYEMCVVNGEYATKSKDFISNMRYETVKGMYAKVYGKSIDGLIQEVSGIPLLMCVRETVLKYIGLDIMASPTLDRLCLLLMFDALVLNDDRHFNNIKFIQTSTGTWELAPAFDFDCSLYSCVEDLDSLEEYSKPSQPFFPTHSEQVELVHSLSKIRLNVSPFNVDMLLEGVWDDKHEIGKKEIKDYLVKVKEGLK